MSAKRKQTGVAAGAGIESFYRQRPGEVAASETASTEEVAVKKMRTTIMLSPNVVAGIEALRAQARKDGNRLTTSQIIETALLDLMRAKKIEV